MTKFHMHVGSDIRERGLPGMSVVVGVDVMCSRLIWRFVPGDNNDVDCLCGLPRWGGLLAERIWVRTNRSGFRRVWTDFEDSAVGSLTFVAFLLPCNEVMTAEVGESIISIVRASSYTLCPTSQDSIVFRNHLIPLHRQSGPNICSQINRWCRIWEDMQYFLHLPPGLYPMTLR